MKWVFWALLFSQLAWGTPAPFVMTATFTKGQLSSGKDGAILRSVTIQKKDLSCRPPARIKDFAYFYCNENIEEPTLKWDALKKFNPSDIFNGIEKYARIYAWVSGLRVKEQKQGLITSCPVPTLKQLQDSPLIIVPCRVEFSGPATVVDPPPTR